MRPFLEERRLGRVEIFRLAVIHDPAAESDDAAATIADREDHAIAKIVVALAATLRLAQQPPLEQQRLGHRAAHHGAFQLVAAIGGKAQTETPDGRIIEPALLQIGARGAAFGPVQHLLEKGTGRVDRGLQRRLALGALTLLARLLRHFESGTARQLLDRFGEREILRLHGEADDVAMRAATEAVKEALFLDDAERRRLLVMEGTEAGEFASAADELHAPPDDLGQ